MGYMLKGSTFHSLMQNLLLYIEPARNGLLLGYNASFDIQVHHRFQVQLKGSHKSDVFSK